MLSRATFPKAPRSPSGMLTHLTLPVSGSPMQELQTKARYAQSPARLPPKTPKHILNR